MHELSVAVSLIDSATEKAIEMGSDRILRLFVRIGPLSGVVPEALAFAFEVASESTRAAGAVLEIEDVPVVVYCASCDREREAEHAYAFCCPTCGTPTSDIRTGRELELRALEIE